METFLQQYGLAILTVIVIAMMILVATPVGNLIRQNLLETIQNFMDQANTTIQGGYWNDNASNSANLLDGLEAK